MALNLYKYLLIVFSVLGFVTYGFSQHDKSDKFKQPKAFAADTKQNHFERLNNQSAHNRDATVLEKREISNENSEIRVLNASLTTNENHCPDELEAKQKKPNTGIKFAKNSLYSTIDKKWEAGGIYEKYTPQDEVLHKRSQNSKTFKNDDGSFTLMLGEKVHYKDDNGIWQNVSYEIKPNKSGEFHAHKFANTTSEIKSFFPEKSGKNGIIVSYKNYSLNYWNNPEFLITSEDIVLSNENAKANSSSLKKNAITYPNIYSNAHQQFIVLEDGSGIEDFITIQEPSAEILNAGNNAELIFKQFIPLEKGWKVYGDNKEQSTNFSANTVSLKTQGFDDGFVFNEVLVFDNMIANKQEAIQIFYAKNEHNELLISELKSHILQGFYKVEFVDNGIILSVVLPNDWFIAQNRQYPVTLDPTVTIGSSPLYKHGILWNGRYCKTRLQSLFLSSDLTTAGVPDGADIFSIALSLSDSDCPGTYEGLKIRAKQTTDATTTGFDNVGYTEYFNGEITTSGSGWYNHDFSTPLTFDASENLLIDFTMDLTAAKCVDPNNNTWRFWNTSSARSRYYTSESCSSDPQTWTGGWEYRLPYMQLTYFTTACTEIAPYTEDFENGGSIPACWSQGSGNNEDWNFSNSGGGHLGNNGTMNGNTSSNGYFAWVDDSDPHNLGTSLLSPYIDVSGLIVPQLSFYIISHNEGYDNVDFSVDIWDGNAWNENVYHRKSNTINGEWEKVTFNLSALTITAPIIVRFVVDDNNTRWNDDVAIDDVSIHEALSCSAANSSVLIFSEEFDNNNAGWTGDIGNEDGDWEIPDESGSGYTGADNALSGLNYMNYEASGNPPPPGIIVSPAIDLTNAADAVELSFWMHAYGASMGDFEVGVGTSASGPFTTEFIWSGELQTSGSDPWRNVIVDLSTYIGQTIYIQLTQNYGGSYTGDMCIDLFELTACLPCLAPTNLSATATTDVSAKLGWTENTVANLWDIEYGNAGFAQGSGTTITGTTHNPHTLTSLIPETDYEFYVRSNCGNGNYSSWAGPFSFITACAAETAPYSEDFENSGNMPLCWNQGASNAEDWNFDNTGQGHTGDAGTMGGNTSSNGYFAWVDDSNPHNSGTTLLSPYIDVSGLTDPELSFYLISNNEGSLNVDFSVDVWDGTEWNNVYFSNSNSLNGEWEKNEINLSSLTFTGSIRVRFVVDDNNSTWYDDVAIDDVSVYEAPTCPVPSVLSATAITTTSADLGWTDNAGASQWDIEIGTSGFTPTGTPTYSGVGNPYTDNTLSAGTYYDFYVRANCGGGDFSNWVGPYTFFTVCNVVNDPNWIETFELDSDTRNCWTQEHVSGTNNWGFWNGAFGGSITSAYDGTVNARFTSSAGGSHITKLISPVLDLTSFSSAVLSFYYAQEYYPPDQNELKVYYSNDGGSTYTEIEHITNDISSWTQVLIDLPNINNNYRIAFEGIDNFGYANVIDNVSIINGCFDPEFLTVGAITHESASLAWFAGEFGTPTSYNIRYKPNGDPSWTNTSSSSPDITLSGLTPNTSYDVEIQSDCGSDGQSDWLVGSFTTLKEPCDIASVDFSASSISPSLESGVYYFDVCQGSTLDLEASAVCNNCTGSQSYYWLINSYDGNGPQEYAQNPLNYTVTYATGYDGAFAIDADNCLSYIPIRIRSSAGPVVNSTSSTISGCAGAHTSIQIGASGSDVEVTPFNGSVSTSLGVSDVTFIPDGPSCTEQCYETSVEFTDFAPGATISSADDIKYIKLNLEHSFIGDLQISLNGPNNCGSAIILQDYFDIANDGLDNDTYDYPGYTAYIDCTTPNAYGYLIDNGGTYSLSADAINATVYLSFDQANDAIDDYFTQNPCTDLWVRSVDNYGRVAFGIPDVSDISASADECDETEIVNASGTGYDYCWSNSPDYAYASGNSYVYEAENLSSYNPADLAYPFYGVNPSDEDNGTNFYHPHQSFGNLIGCPLNGTWTIKVCDSWALDNGWVFDWSMTLDDDLLPENWSYTALVDHIDWNVAPDATAQYVSGGGIDDIIYDIIPDYNLTTGTHNGSFTVIDEYACSSTETNFDYEVSGIPSIIGIEDGDYVWSGNTSAIWDNTTETNWTLRNSGNYTEAISPPSTGENVFIVDYCDASNDPTLSEDVHCNDFTIISGELTFDAGRTLYVAGDFDNQDVFNALNGNVIFNGGGIQQINSGGDDFYNVVFNNNAGLDADILLLDDMEIANSANFMNGILNTNGNNLIFASAATSTIGNSNSFVDGNIRKLSFSNSFTFPLGDVNSRDIGEGIQTYKIWAPFTANPNSVTDVNAQYYFSNDNLNTWWYHDWTHQAPLTHTSDREYWLVNASSDLNATLHWKNNNPCEIHDFCEHGTGTFLHNDLTIAYWDGIWKDAGGTAATDFENGSISSLIPFSAKGETQITFGAKNPDLPLPVELITFTGTCVENKVNISWQTASEINNSHFILESSENMTDFTKLATVNGNGNSQISHTYNYALESVKPLTYYRLTQVDFDGKQTIYSPIVLICNSEDASAVMTVYPNPYTSNIYVNVDYFEQTSAVLMLFDQTGKTVFKQNITLNAGQNSFVYDLSDLKPAVYQLQLLADKQIINTRILKK